jgi:ornithine cyclodeaminase
MPRHEHDIGEPAREVPADTSLTTLLDASAIGRLVTISEVIEAITAAAREQVAGLISPAQRASLLKGSTLLMAAASEDRSGVAGKLVSIVPSNRTKGLATIQGLAIWLDHTTRRPLMLADATTLTALRTGALSAVATRALARPEASCLAMIGAGGQALAQVESVLAVRPLEEVRIVSEHAETAEQLRGVIAWRFPDLKASVSPDIGSAVADADIVCLATTARAPLVELADVPAHVHVNAVGAYRPDMMEVGVSLFAGAGVVCVDDRGGALREAGDLMAAIAAGKLDESSVRELGELTEGDGAHSHAPTIFKSVGSAAADLALLHLLAERAAGHPDLPRFDFAK